MQSTYNSNALKTAGLEIIATAGFLISKGTQADFSKFDQREARKDFATYKSSICKNLTELTAEYTNTCINRLDDFSDEQKQQQQKLNKNIKAYLKKY